MPDKITIAAYRNHAGGHQVQIARTDENGSGDGYRLAGGKHYNSGTTELVSAELDEHDAREIRGYLDAVFPLTVHQLRAGAPDDIAPMRLGLYANENAAKAHGEAEYRNWLGGIDALSWRHWTGDDPGVIRLHATDDSSEPTPTNWHIVPMTAAAEYDADAEG